MYPVDRLPLVERSLAAQVGPDSLLAPVVLRNRLVVAERDSLLASVAAHSLPTVEQDGPLTSEVVGKEQDSLLASVAARSLQVPEDWDSRPTSGVAHNLLIVVEQDSLQVEVVGIEMDTAVDIEPLYSPFSQV